MSGYIIANMKVHNPQGYREYLAGFMDKLRPYDGRILVTMEDLGM